jgi:hypothetical protein
LGFIDLIVPELTVAHRLIIARLLLVVKV